MYVQIDNLTTEERCASSTFNVSLQIDLMTPVFLLKRHEILTSFCSVSSSGSPAALPSYLTLTLACVGSARRTPTVED